LTPKCALAHATAFIRGLNLETNVGSITFNVGGAAVSASNHFAAVSLSMAGNTFTGTIKADRMPMAWDIFPGVSNQVATTLWENIPNYGAEFQWLLQFTNFPQQGNWTLSVDGVAIATCTTAQWATGYNLATNDVANSPWNAQRTAVLYLTRDLYGVNHTNGLQTHTAGELGPNGGDLINFQSNGNNQFGSLGNTGATLVNNMFVWTSNLFYGYAVPIHNAAQQTNHTFSLALTSGASSITTNAVGTLWMGKLNYKSPMTNCWLESSTDLKHWQQDWNFTTNGSDWIVSNPRGPRFYRVSGELLK
jgi:hypothetical protein